ncbi:MAG: hypothetical protein ACYC0T_11040 [Ramlibacter sp.]
MDEDALAGECCGSAVACVFSKALLARTAACELAQRSSRGEQELIACGAPVARINCSTLAALLHERARFALRLPAPGRPLMHVHALRLQCGGLAALTQVLGGDGDVHRMVAAARERHGSLADLPWERIVPAVAGWQPRRRTAPRE